MKTGSLKIAIEVKEKFDALINDFGGKFTQSEMLAYLIDMHALNNAKTAVTGKFGHSEMNKRTVSATEKVRLFIEAVLKHNANEATAKTNRFVFIGSVYFLKKETKMHGARDIKPVFEVMESAINTQIEKLGIESAHNSKHAKLENGQLQIITEILTKEGIADLFGR